MPDDDVVASALHSAFPVGDDNTDENPYWVPPHERLDNDEEDPESVADRNGADLSFVNPDEGELVLFDTEEAS